MNKILRGSLLAGSVLLAVYLLVFLLHKGASYYTLPIETRFFHPLYNVLKPSGTFGHAYGIIGTLLILSDLFSYMARKRFRFMWTWGTLKYWLDAHMVLCTLGTLLVVFHTTFKFGGIISIGFWSLVLVWLSGFVGRFIQFRFPQNKIAKWWNYAHVPVALIVLLFLIIHVAVVLYLGYNWIL